MIEYLMVGEAAKILGLSSEMVRCLANSGQLKTIRASGMRLFDRQGVERLAKDRQLQPHDAVGRIVPLSRRRKWEVTEEDMDS